MSHADNIEIARLMAENERLRKLNGDWAESAAAALGERDVLHAQLDATRATIGTECVEHVELSGHIDIANQAHDYLVQEAIDDQTGKLHDFTIALRIVIDQLDRQRRRANWYEAVYDAGKTKLIEHAVDKATADIAKERDSLLDRIADAETELRMLRSFVGRMRPVFEAAVKWRSDSRRGNPQWRGSVDALLGQAIDAATTTKEVG